MTDLETRVREALHTDPAALSAEALLDDVRRGVRRRRARRRTGVVVAGALSVLVVAGGVVGLTGHNPSQPEPAGPFKHDQTVRLSQAVPASSLPGYRLEPWTVPSVQNAGQALGDVDTYQDVDAAGRLIVQDYPGGVAAPLRVRLYDAPGEAPQPLKVPASPGNDGGTPPTPISWSASFLGANHLLWIKTPGVGNAFRITDLQGGHGVLIHSDFHWGTTRDDVEPGMGSAWLGGGRVWFLAFDRNLPSVQGSASTLYTASFSGQVTKVADNVLVASVSDGVAAWVTTNGRVVTESTAGGSPQHAVDVPLSPGCRISPAGWLQSSGDFAVTGSAIALTERCGTGNGQLDELLAFDLSGHLLVHVTGVTASRPSFAGNSLLFGGLDANGKNWERLRYDLVDGRLARLMPPTPDGSHLGLLQGAGAYVLWYDAKGGHVAKIPTGP